MGAQVPDLTHQAVTEPHQIPPPPLLQTHARHAAQASQFRAEGAAWIKTDQLNLVLGLVQSFHQLHKLALGPTLIELANQKAQTDHGSPEQGVIGAELFRNTNSLQPLPPPQVFNFSRPKPLA